MGTSTQFTDFSDLYGGLINAVRQQTGVTVIETAAKRAVNVALQDMHLGTDYKLPWAERDAVLFTQALYNTGTVTVARGATAITGSGTAWNTNNDFSVKNMRYNGVIVFEGSRVPYRIASVSTDTGADIANKFTETSITDGTYTYFEDEYDLAADFLRPIDAQVFSEQTSIDLISTTEFRRRYPSNVLTGKPTSACIVFSQTSAASLLHIKRVKFNKAPNAFISIPYAYITSFLSETTSGRSTNLVSDSDQPIVPLRYRHAIFYHALYGWYRDKKDDSRSQEAKAEYVDIMTRILMDVDVGANKPQMAPRTSNYKRSAQSPYGGMRGRWSRP